MEGEMWTPKWPRGLYIAVMANAGWVGKNRGSQQQKEKEKGDSRWVHSAMVRDAPPFVRSKLELLSTHLRCVCLCDGPQCWGVQMSGKGEAGSKEETVDGKWHGASMWLYVNSVREGGRA